MPYINNIKFKEIKESAKNGNEKALMVLQALRKGSKQEEINNLMNDYYGLNNNSEIITEEKEVKDGEEKEIKDGEEKIKDEVVLTENPEIKSESIENKEEVITPKKDEKEVETKIEGENKVLDEDNKILETNSLDSLTKDTEDLFDENEIKDISFKDFLTEKERNGLRAKKNADYFKMYNADDRHNFMQRKIDDYKNKFNDSISNNQRRYDDMTNAMNIYSNKVNELLDDEIELNNDNVVSVYNDLLTNNNYLSSFGRYWDENDVNNIYEILYELIKKYGKKNVSAALNTFKEDIENYKSFLDNRIDEEINRYSKKLENLFN